MTEAIHEWTTVLGESAVKTDDATLSRYARTTSVESNCPAAVLYPQNTAQVSDLVKIAARHRAPIYPISRGKNWGYGAANAPTGGQTIVDLSRMNRIVEVNVELAYAVIEPGVTQGQLHEHLRKLGGKLWMDASGAGLEASVLGNTIDRGFGHTPAGDHFLQTANLEVVLPDGSVVRTGFGHMQGAGAGPGANATAHVFRSGVGPSLDGLFTQSSLGIVTRGTIWLNPAPQRFAAFFASTPDPAALAELVDRLRPLRIAGILRSAIHVANDLRVMSSRIPYPADLAGGEQFLTPDVRRKLARDLDIGEWNVSGGIYGTCATVCATKKAVRRAMRGLGARLIFLDDRKLALAKRLVGVANKLGAAKKTAALLKVVEPAYGLLKGVPSDEFLRGVLWKLPPDRLAAANTSGGGSLDPLDHNVGLMWIAPVVPATGQHARKVVDLLEPIFHHHRFDFAITLSLVTERSLVCITDVTFDRGNAAQAQRAKACYDEAMSAILAAGYPPYRTGIGGFEKLRGAGSPFWDACRTIKSALDPNGIMSPGRYI